MPFLLVLIRATHDRHGLGHTSGDQDRSAAVWGLSGISDPCTGLTPHGTDCLIPPAKNNSLPTCGWGQVWDGCQPPCSPSQHLLGTAESPRT